MATDRRALLAAIAIACALPATGCFTFVGAFAGGITDPAPTAPPRRSQPRRPPPRLLEDDLPPGWRLAEEPAPPPPETPTGMPGAVKGMLVGAFVDATILGVAYLLFHNINSDWGC